jgi:uncharacterized protein YprB with RNaseH-like and TPR domain
MLDTLDLHKIVFMDIETVPVAADFEQLEEDWKKLWEKKASHLKREEGQEAEDLYERAGIYAEFGKVICISIGIFRQQNNGRQFRIKSFSGEKEREVLEKCARLLSTNFHSSDYLLCAHNGKEFDFPFLARRMLVNRIKLPGLLDIAGRKPWEVQHLDTLQLWKFGDYKHYTSLEVLSKLFTIPSPKDQMEGKDVFGVYYKEKNLPKIVDYCQQDTLTVAQLILRFRGENLLKRNEIIIVD